MFDKVLVLSASAGSGHLSAAEALKSAFEMRQAARVVRHIDALEYTNKLFRRVYSKTYIDLVNNAPEVLGWLYDHLDKPWKNEKRRLAFDKLNTRPFVKMLEAEQPDIVVCTHFLPAEIISWLKYKNRLDCRLAIVVTDFDVHAMWLCQHFDHYFVALEETRVHLSELGIPSDKITVTGIPINPLFAEHKDRQAMRRQHGLREDRITFLVSAGGFGVGPIEHLLAALAKLKTPAQVVAICGRSDELKTRLEKSVRTLPSGGAVDFKIIGFTRQMDEWMTAADLIVGKPGGLTTSEALAKGLVFVIVNPIPGQEERNSDHLLEWGAAIRVNNLPAMAYKIDQLLGDTERFEAMRDKARALGRAEAAFTIVDTLVGFQSRSSAG
ncbi:MAG: glycosyltransferase [Gammaproteobacteria bacterium]|nr:glycosyltransferase [Gammaproteobacteria bacterium]MCP5458081.1 glycosyltransferase [Gammaproteobacteria bacterium]